MAVHFSAYGIFLLYNLRYGQGQFGVDTCGRLDVSARRIGYELADNVLVVLYPCSLQYLLSSRERSHGSIDGVLLGSVGVCISGLVTEVDIELAQSDVCH